MESTTGKGFLSFSLSVLSLNRKSEITVMPNLQHQEQICRKYYISSAPNPRIYRFLLEGRILPNAWGGKKNFYTLKITVFGDVTTCSLVYRVQLKGADNLWARVPHAKTGANVHNNTCPEQI
jgi:hypothetical protein